MLRLPENGRIKSSIVIFRIDFCTSFRRQVHGFCSIFAVFHVSYSAKFFAEPCFNWILRAVSKPQLDDELGIVSTIIVISKSIIDVTAIAKKH